MFKYIDIILVLAVVESWALHWIADNKVCELNRARSGRGDGGEIGLTTVHGATNHR